MHCWSSLCNNGMTIINIVICRSSSFFFVPTKIIKILMFKVELCTMQPFEFRNYESIHKIFPFTNCVEDLLFCKRKSRKLQMVDFEDMNQFY